MRGLTLVAPFWVLGAELASAQTGKLDGTVRDSAGSPLEGAQVIVVGTAFSATTSHRGYFFINNVPVGTLTLQARSIGYIRVELQGVRMLAEETITQDFQLQAAPVQLQDLTVLAAGNPLVPRDEVTTKQRIDGEFTENLPVDQVNQVLELQPGVVASPTGNSLSIRGGRADEAAVYLDGVSIQPGNRGNGIVAAGTNSKAGGWVTGLTAYNSTVLASNPGAGSSSSAGVTIASNGLEEAAVITGATAAQYGNAQSGIVTIATTTGGSRFAGRLAVETDAIFGTTMGMGYNRLEANLSGPLGLRGLTFNVAGAADGNLSARSGKGRENFPIFVSSGIDTTVLNPLEGGGVEQVDVNSYSVYSGSCDAFAHNSNAGMANNYGEACHGARLPASSFSSFQATGNINWSYGNGSRLRLGGAFSQAQGKNFAYGVVLNPGIAANQQTGFRAQNAVWTANWTQNLAKSPERALALDLNLSYQTDRFVQSPFADGGPGAGTLGFYFSPIPLQYGFSMLDSTYVIGGETLTKLDCFIRSIKSCSGVLPLDNADSVSAHTAHNIYRSNPYGVENSYFPDGGLSNARVQLYEENRWVATASLDWQLDRYNRVQVGGEYVGYSMTSYSQLIAEQAYADFWKEQPVRYAAFVQDRLDIGDVVLQVGLRYDYFSTRARRWNGFPRISTNPALDSLPPGTDPTVFYVPDGSFDELSPRIQVAFPVTERTSFRLSYAQAVETPDFAVVLGGINTDVSVSGGLVYGQNLDYGKSKIFEFGIQHAFNDDMVLDFAAYNRDNLANAAGRLVSAFDPLRQQSSDLALLTNADFGNTKGFDLRLNRRFGQLFNGTIGYSFTSAQNTGSDPYTYLFSGTINQVTGGNQPPPQAIAPTMLSRPHNLVASLALTFPDAWNAGSTIGTILQNVGVFVALRFASGTAYTGCQTASGNEAVRSPATCNRGGFRGGINTLRLPSFKQFDLRFVKGVNLGHSQLSLYLDARNLLNFTNVLTQYVVTNSITSQVEQQNNFSADSTLYASEGVQNGVYDLVDGSLDLRFGGARASGCDTWTNLDNVPSVPNCIYLSRAEQRWGNGDGRFTLAEQLRASNALYYAATAAPTYFYGAGTQLRLGVELGF
jgi:hypothetical protein